MILFSFSIIPPFFIISVRIFVEVVKLTVQTCSAGGIEPPLQTADLKTLSIKERLNYTIIAKIVKSSSFFVVLLTFCKNSAIIFS